MNETGGEPWSDVVRMINVNRQGKTIRFINRYDAVSCGKCIRGRPLVGGIPAAIWTCPSS